MPVLSGFLSEECGVVNRRSKNISESFWRRTWTKAKILRNIIILLEKHTICARSRFILPLSFFYLQEFLMCSSNTFIVKLSIPVMSYFSYCSQHSTFRQNLGRDQWGCLKEEGTLTPTQQQLKAISTFVECSWPDRSCF